MDAAKTALMWFGLSSGFVCLIVIAAVVCSLVYDRVIYGRWVWADEDWPRNLYIGKDEDND